MCPAPRSLRPQRLPRAKGGVEGGLACVRSGVSEPGSVPPGSVPPGSVPPGSVPPAAYCLAGVEFADFFEARLEVFGCLDREEARA